MVELAVSLGSGLVTVGVIALLGIRVWVFAKALIR